MSKLPDVRLLGSDETARQCSCTTGDATLNPHSLPTAVTARTVSGLMMLHGVDDGLGVVEAALLVPLVKGCDHPHAEVAAVRMRATTATALALPSLMPEPGRDCSPTSVPLAWAIPQPTAAASGAPMTVSARMATEVHPIAGPHLSRATRPSAAPMGIAMASAPRMPMSNHTTRSEDAMSVPPMS